MRILFVLSIIGFLSSCADLNKEKQLKKVALLNISLDSLEKELSVVKIDSMESLKLSTSTVELRIKTYLFSDKIDVELSGKMNAYKRMRRALNPLGKAYSKVKNGIMEERGVLKNLKADIENGFGEREKYDEYIAFETNKISSLSVLLNDYKEQKEVVFKTYNQLHDELYMFSMELMAKHNKTKK